MEKPRFAVILSGSGVFDGAEIHEATFTLYAILKNGGEYSIFAPNINQHHVINHISGEEMDETRNVLIESARIARGDIKDLNEFDANEFDAIILPGGFGVAKNLCDFAFNGADIKIIPQLEKAIKDMAKLNKPIGALCISPVVIAKVLDGVELTIGKDEETAKAIEEIGAKHKITNHGEVVVDKKYKVATTACYMLDATVIDIHDGAINVVNAMMELL